MKTNLDSAFERFGFETSLADDEITLLWSKLVFLSPVALSTAAYRRPIGEVLSERESLARLQASVREACAVATAAGAKVNADAVLAAIKSLPAGFRSSMQKDLTDGKAPELDAIAGPIIRGGEAYGVDIRTTSELASAIAKESRTVDGGSPD